MAEEVYNPTIQALLDKASQDWADPEENRKSLVRYGIKALDKALYGINTTTGELNVILGPEKQRKTTLLLNILLNIQQDPRLDDTTRPGFVLDTLESGMNPERVRDSLVSMMATKKMMLDGHRYMERCPACDNAKCGILGISPEFLMYNNRSKHQQEAIDWAFEEMRKWRLHIYGAALRQGNTRSMKVATPRWTDLVKEGYKIFASDHIQQYSFSDASFESDYEKQIQGVSRIAEFVAQNNTAFFLLSQVSLTSQRAAQSGTDRIRASGGQKGAQEANTILATEYTPGSGRMTIKLMDSRKAGRLDTSVELEDASGAFYGEQVTI